MVVLSLIADGALIVRVTLYVLARRTVGHRASVVRARKRSAFDYLLSIFPPTKPVVERHCRVLCWRKQNGTEKLTGGVRNVEVSDAVSCSQRCVSRRRATKDGMYTSIRSSMGSRCASSIDCVWHFGFVSLFMYFLLFTLHACSLITFNRRPALIIVQSHYP